MTDWWRSFVQIRRADGEKGSGALISPTEVLTAAHVVAPDGVAAAPGDVTVDIRYEHTTATARSLALLPDWESNASIGSDLALIRIDAAGGTGLQIRCGFPDVKVQARLSASGFVAQTDVKRDVQGNLVCRKAPDGSHYLYARDFRPEHGMSGGPIYGGLDGGVRLVGALTRASDSGLVGLSILASVLDELRRKLPA